MSMQQDYDVKNVGTQKQLFIDDYIIESMNDVEKVLNQPEKYPGNPIVKMDQPWEVGTYKWPTGRNMTQKEMAMADKHGTLIYVTGSVEYDKEEDIYKMWCMVTNYSFIDRILSYLTSRDGIHWEKPALGLVKYRGYDTNFLLNGKIVPRSLNYVKEDKNSENWPGNGDLCVFKDPVAVDPNRRYKMLYHIIGGREHQDLYGGSSPDGIHWTPWEGKPLPGKGDSQDVVYWDYKNKKYMACVRLNLHEGPRCWLRVVEQMESADFKHWSDRVPVMKADEKDGPYDRQFYHMNVMQYEDIYIGLLDVYHIIPEYERKQLGSKRIDNMDIQLTCSRDGRRWMRAGDRKVFLPNSPKKGSYDYGCIWPLQQPLPIIVNDEIYIYYIGWSGGHWYMDRGEPNEGPVCIAKLRLDGFVSLDALNKGVFTTKPFSIVEGSNIRELRINFKAGKQGFVLVEVLDLHGRPIQGFTKEDCDALSGDEIRRTVTWKGKTDLSKLEGKIVKLKFYLSKAKLFSFQFLR